MLWTPLIWIKHASNKESEQVSIGHVMYVVLHGVSLYDESNDWRSIRSTNSRLEARRTRLSGPGTEYNDQYDYKV